MGPQGDNLYDPRSPDLLRDPHPYYRRLRAEAPLYYNEEHDFFVLSRFEDIFKATRAPETFSSASGLTFEEDEIQKLGIPPTIVMMDAPQHTQFRRLIAKGFTPRQVTRLEQSIRDFVVQRVEDMVEKNDVDFVAELAGPLPTHVLALLMDVPNEDRHRFDPWSNAIVQATSAEGGVLKAAMGAVMGLFQYFQGIISQRLANPGDDLISALAHAEVDGERLTVPEIVGFCFVMVAGGNDTSTGLIGGAAELMFRQPEQRAKLVADPALIGPAIEEFLRLTSPVQGLCRTTTRDVELHGQTVPEGKKVQMLYASGNRDEREYGPTSEQLDVTRKVERMLSFSSGPHFCLGAALARMQGRMALEELLARAPDYSLDLDAARMSPGMFVRRFESLPMRLRQ